MIYRCVIDIFTSHYWLICHKKIYICTCNTHTWDRILVQVTIYRRLLIGRDGHLDQSEAYDISELVREYGPGLAWLVKCKSTWLCTLKIRLAIYIFKYGYLKYEYLKGLAQAEIIKKSVILFRVLNMTIWCKHVHRLELQIFIVFVLRIHQLG